MTDDGLPLAGCTPEPLMNYLKTLGVFRLVADQADSAARLAWQNGHAVLHSQLDRAALADFFSITYEPTPIIVPWSGGDFFGVSMDGDSGPYVKAPTATRVIEAVLATDTARLEGYRTVIRQLYAVMAHCGIRSKSDIEGASKKAAKAKFLCTLRSMLPEQVVDWIDASGQSGDEAVSFNPLLGSGGGNDGNTHFSDNFMQNLWDCLPDFDAQRKRPQEQRPSIRNALFSELDGALTQRTGALYDSGAVGGPNATQGMKRPFLVNPWDFILAMEGLLVFAGGLAKRHGSHSRAAASFPFVVRMTAAGSDFGSCATKEYQQHEIWLPLWTRFLSLAEAKYLFREGRTQINRRPAENGADMARAIATKGVSAGIDEFVRYGLIRGRVGGENYFTATSIGRYRVRYGKSITLLDQLDPWLLRFAQANRDDKTPARVQSQFRRLDQVIADACRAPSAQQSISPLITVLREIGRTERWLANTVSFCTKRRIRPFQGLSPDWLRHADDGSPEFRLAAALAGIRSRKGCTGPFRTYLEEVETRGARVDWLPESCSAMWTARPLDENLAAVFLRRQIEVFQRGQGTRGVPLNSPRVALLDDVISFLRGNTDDDKLADLLWGLTTVDWSDRDAVKIQPEPAAASEVENAPFEFGIARLLVEPLPLVARNGRWTLVGESAGEPSTPDPAVFHELASGRREAISDAITRAARRHKSDGRMVVGYRSRHRSGHILPIQSPFGPQRLLAAMLVPLSYADLAHIANTVLLPPESED